MKPTVSIIIPLFNRADLVFETIDSIRAQTLPSWEAIVVDDGSTDGGPAKIQDGFANDPRVRVSHREFRPKGAPTCRNQGIYQSTGQYLVFLDSDDCLGPTCLEKRVNHLIEHPEHDFVACTSESFVEQLGDTDLQWNKPASHDPLDRFLRQDVPWSICGPMWRRATIEELGGFDLNLKIFQDWEFHIRALARGYQFAHLEEVDTYIRVAAGHQSITSKARGKLLIEESLSAWQAVIESLDRSDKIDLPRRRLLVKKLFQIYEKSIQHDQPQHSDLILEVLQRIPGNRPWQRNAFEKLGHVSSRPLRRFLFRASQGAMLRPAKRHRSTFQDSCIKPDVLEQARRAAA